MAQGISDFEGWLERLEERVSGADLIQMLNTLAHSADDAFGARLWFVEILGKRWSYIAGRISGEPTTSATDLIRLSEQTGLVSDTWGALAEEQQDRLVAFLKRLLSSRGSA